MDDKAREAAVRDRLAHLQEHLAALIGYGNGDGQRAATARAEIAGLEVEVAELAVDAARRRKEG